MVKKHVSLHAQETICNFLSLQEAKRRNNLDKRLRLRRSQRPEGFKILQRLTIIREFGMLYSGLRDIQSREVHGGHAKILAKPALFNL